MGGNSGKLGQMGKNLFDRGLRCHYTICKRYNTLCILPVQCRLNSGFKDFRILEIWEAEVHNCQVGRLPHCDDARRRSWRVVGLSGCNDVGSQKRQAVGFAELRIAKSLAWESVGCEIFGLSRPRIPGCEPANHGRVKLAC